MTEKQPPAPKPRAGFLHCDVCDRYVPFQGGPEPIGPWPWPLHRCAGWTTAPFTSWSMKAPANPATNVAPFE